MALPAHWTVPFARRLSHREGRISWLPFRRRSCLKYKLFGCATLTVRLLPRERSGCNARCNVATGALHCPSDIECRMRLNISIGLLFFFITQ